MTLALLITAVGGAWADETPIATILASENSTFVSGSKTFADKVKITFSGAVDWVNNRWQVVYDSTNGNEGTVTVEGVNGTNISKVVFYDEYGSHVMTTSPYTLYFYQAPELSDYIVCTGANGEGETDLSTITKIEVFGGSAPAVEVTTNAAEEGATFTEASFQMPAFDATAEYELVRDMGYKVAFSGVPTRARLAKDGEGKFHFADGLTFQLLDNIDAANPKDITSAEGITFMVGEVEAVDFEGNTFYQLNKATLVPLADFLADAHLGNYAICAVASTGEYDGSFTSGRIELFQGYEVTIPAGEYATFYKDENLYTEDEDAELYTIASVTDTEAVLSDAIKVAPAETPLLVYNKSEQDKTFLLIPTTDDADEVTPATQFVGTLEATTIPASATGADNYALNGYAFVWVKNAIEVGANKCWLQIGDQPAAARAMTRSIVGGGNTTNMDDVRWQMEDGNYYDLQGRKVAKPTRGGIYIHNGKKVILK